jgi:hypothetical protein
LQGGVTGCAEALLGAGRCYWVRGGVAGCGEVLLGAGRRYRARGGVTGCREALLGAGRCDWAQGGVTGCGEALLGAGRPRRYWVRRPVTLHGLGVGPKLWTPHSAPPSRFEVGQPVRPDRTRSAAHAPPCWWQWCLSRVVRLDCHGKVGSITTFARSPHNSAVKLKNHSFWSGHLRIGSETAGIS